MNFSTLFKKKSDSRRKVNVLQLKENDLCYYDHFREPFRVVETGETDKGLHFVIIKNDKSGKSHIFTDNYPVTVEEAIYAE